METSTSLWYLKLCSMKCFPQRCCPGKVFVSHIGVDRNRNGGGDIILYVRYDVPSRVIKKFQDNIEYFFVQTNLRQKKISAR